MNPIYHLVMYCGGLHWNSAVRCMGYSPVRGTRSLLSVSPEGLPGLAPRREGHPEHVHLEELLEARRVVVGWDRRDPLRIVPVETQMPRRSEQQS